MAVGSKKNLPPQREDFLNTCQIKLPKEISYIKNTWERPFEKLYKAYGEMSIKNYVKT